MASSLSENYPDYGAIAQLGEHLLCKQGVVGSIPTSSTMLAKSIIKIVFLPNVICIKVCS
jgi:hypothetical protein